MHVNFLSQRASMFLRRINNKSSMIWTWIWTHPFIHALQRWDIHKWQNPMWLFFESIEKLNHLQRQWLNIKISEQLLSCYSGLDKSFVAVTKANSKFHHPLSFRSSVKPAWLTNWHACISVIKWLYTILIQKDVRSIQRGSWSNLA